MRISILGGGGFLGRKIAQRLAREGTLAGRPVRDRKVRGVMNLVAAVVMTTSTSAPVFSSSRTSCRVVARSGYPAVRKAMNAFFFSAFNILNFLSILFMDFLKTQAFDSVDVFVPPARQVHQDYRIFAELLA